MSTQATVKQRLISYLDYIKVGQTKFETMCDLSRGYISQIKSSPGGEQLKKIKDANPELSLDWLITGQGSMILTEEIQHSENTKELLNIISEKDKEIEFLRSIIAKLMSQQPELPHVTNPTTDMGIKYYEDMMREIKEMKEEIKKSI